MRIPHQPWPLIGLVLVIWPQSLSAHLVDSGVAPFYDGWMHFWYSPLDWLPVVGLGLLGGRSGRSAARNACWGLATGWLAGTFFGWNGWVFGPEEVIGGGLTLFVGSWAATGWRMTPALAFPVAALMGIALGSANGLAVAATGSSATTIAGMVTAVSLLVLWVGAIAATRPEGWQVISVRVLASWTAAVGLLSLAWYFRPV